MAVKRYYAKIDNTITNAFEENLTTRGTGSNMGASDILEVFSIFAQANSSSAEESRVLLKFDATASTNSITADRTAGVIPASGSVSFYLRMFNAKHGQTLPKNFTMDVSAISGAWDEGTGLDMEGYKDKDDSNWTNRLPSTAWSTTGGDYYTDTSSSFSASFDSGVEDLEVDITTLVEQWASSSANSKTATNMGSKNDDGIGVFLSSVYSGESRSYYTKKFFGRGTEFHFKKPYIEARWDSATKDDRGTFFFSSSLATAAENLNTLYFYNYFRGQLRNIPSIGTGNIYLSIYSGSADDSAPSGSRLNLVADETNVTSLVPTVVTGGYVSTGIYSASFAATGTLTTLYDVWHDGDAGTVEFQTGTIKPEILYASTTAPDTTFASSITNLKNVYRGDETARFRVYTRQKDWSPTIYTKATAQAEVNIVESGSYEIYRVVDDLKVIPYGTGSTLHTQMSFDADGSYFDLDMEMLEKGYMYGIKLAYYNNSVGSWVEQPETFKFRVESRQSE